ncbi:hypothetical protein [Anaeroselena agilis]|uniref:MnmC-like methyltransferase domain-containing protein n=1 Tax=Anaeroselena agilis TaxID=3063788 RepID=A0ABU3NXS2_9FIRM|nr:hypothetical protein [Selenomonadales bacterium 4137-cl]
MCNAQGCFEGVYEAFEKRLLKDGVAVCFNALTAEKFAARLAAKGIRAARTETGGKRHEFRLEGE